MTGGSATRVTRPSRTMVEQVSTSGAQEARCVAGGPATRVKATRETYPS